MSDEKSGTKSGELVPQEHGGALKRGGDHPRPGRPSNELRRSLRAILEEGLPSLKEFVQGERGTTSDQLRALETVARHGLEGNADESLVKELGAAVAEVLHTQPDGDELLREILARWMPIIAERM